MFRVRSSLVLGVVFVLAGALLAADAEQGSRRGAGSSRRGSGFSGRRGSLTDLLSLEQVQKELKLNEEQKGKVEQIGKKLRAEMREQYAGLREITDPEKRRAKSAELSDQLDDKTREQLREVISREQLIRLYQIRIQIRGAVYALSNEYVAGRLKLTDEQKTKVAEIDKSARQKQSKLYAGLRDAGQEERTKAFAELRKIRQQGDKEALGLLTAEQKEGLEKIKGEKLELQRRRSRQ